MSNTPRACTVRRLIGGALLALCIGLAIERAGAQQQGSAGANVNVISGTGADGDWTLQRQNEPSIACSSRNPLNCLAGANDYRTVDIPFPTSGEKVTGDAWLGWYTTKNGGLTWRTRLLPGYPQDTSAVGHASPLRGYAAGADPVIRPGTNGLFYYGGLVFNREEGGGSAIFVARFIDNNNQEGTAGEPIDYLGASIVHRIGAAPTVVARRQGREGRPARATAARRPTTPANTRAARVRAGVEQPGTTTQMVDKPWIAVDVPRAGAQTCSIGGAGTGTPLQTFPGGRVYMAYALFDGPDEQRGRIMFSSSANCGVTWSAPRVLSRVQSADVNDDGIANATDVNLTRAALGRVCGHPAFPSNADYNNDCKIDIVDLTLIGRAVGQPVPTQPRLSQGATIAIDPRNGLDGGAVQITWRQFDDGVLGDAIVTVRSVNGGASFSSPRVVATLSPFEQGTTDTSFRTNAFPTMAMDGTGRAYLAWSARGHAVNRPSPADGDGRVVLSTSVDGVTWSTPRPVDNQQNPGHQIMPALAFAQGKLQLIYYDLREDVSQLFGPFVDEQPILAGPPPRVRHTVDVWGAQADPGEHPLFTPFRISQYRSGGAPGSQTVAPLEYNPPNLPIFRAGTSPFMGDYLDVATDAPFVRNGSTWSFNNAATASPVFHGIWTDNRDIRPPANGRWTDYTPPNPPFARPTMSLFDPTQAIPACVPGQAGMRNQNIYTARITRGLVVGAVGNSRRLGSIQRSFPVFAQNNGTTVKSYRLTITNQPVGGQASFKQFEPLTTLDVQVPRRSTVARTVFARSTDPFAQINVSVTEIAAPGGAPVTGGQQGTIVLNPDPTNPDLENPDLENPDLENPDLENSEVHNPDLENATTRNPDLENPDLENPDLENPDLENTRVANPSIINPDLENPDLENPDLENPDLENPDLENPDLENGALSDTTWTVTNKGNTASAYTVRLALNRQLPEGFRSQLIAHKVYQTPAALGCSLLKQSQTVLIANIPTARFVTPAELANPDLENPDLENLTIAIAPGETVRITLRVYDPVKADAITFRAAENVTPVAVAQAVNTPDADQGITQPAAAGVLTSSAPVPGGTSGGDYSTALTSTLPGTWTVAGGTVPPGLTVDPATGGITGTPTTPGTYTFTARFQSTIGIIDYRTVTITVGAVGADANVGVAATGPGAPVAIGTPFAYTLTVSNAGPAAASNVRLTDTLPEGTQFVSATTTAGTCQHANGTLLCTLGTLESGAAATIVLTVRPTIGGPHTNRAVVSADQADPVATNNAAVSTATSAGLTPCTTVCFSGPTAYVASPFGTEFGAITGDFNEDGHVDLAYGPAGVNTVGILLGNGTGGFGAPRLMTIPGSPDDGRVADFNNDGHLDLVIMSHDVAQAWVFLGNGLGEFGTPAIIALPNAAENVVPADFNRDGNVDLALSGNGTGPLVMILLGNGNGTFQAATTIGTATASSSLVVDDFNNDSNPDLALHTDNVGLTIIIGNGTSGFQPATAIPVPNASGVVKVGDLTGDGFADLIVGTVPPTGPSELRIYVGNGTGGFAPGGKVGDPALTNDAPATGDLDSDGDLDFVWARTGGGVGIQLNDGLGNFAAPFYLSSLPASQPIIADLNGDGRPDLVLPAGAPFLGQSQVLVFLNTCDRPPADLAITLEAPAGPIAEGTTSTYIAQVTNNGPNTATGVQLDVTVLGFGEILSIGGASGCSIVGFGVTCQLGALASGATAAVTVNVLAVSGGSLQAHAGVTATTSDQNPANNAAFTQTAITPGASTLTVTNVSDGGPGSLRLAMLRANDGGPRDTIVFNIPGAGVHTIRPPALALPGLGQPVVIDGTTQPGYSGTPLIEIDGTTAGTVNGLGLFGGNSIIRGLALNRFRQAGIFVGSAGNTIEGNFIGTDPTGTLARPNGGGGIDIRGANNTIGGTTAGTRNLISGNNNGGINISTSAATGNAVVGNFIGTNAAGTAAIGNGHGVNIVGGASNTTVGGTASGARNILSGNSAYGVRIADAGTSGNRVLGNFVGTNATGTAAIPNGLSGVFIISGASGNTIGGTQPAEGNVISGNSSFGVAFFGAATDVGGNTVLNNFIGTDAAGTAAIGNNASGVFVETSNNRIGSLTAGIGNTIAFNGDVGVRVGAGTGNAIVNNRIFSNASLGIDLAPLGVTANDAGDTDTGANNLLNHPVLSSARIVGPNVLVQVALSPTPTGPGQIHFYANSACDASGSGEGQTPIGVSSFGVNPGGDTNFEASFSATQVPAGSFITATATDSGGNTSEFSPCALVAGSPGTANLGITKQDSPDPVAVGSPLTYLISVNNAGPDASSNAVVTDVLPANVTLVSAVSTGGGCSGTTTVTCTLNSIASGAGITISIVVTPNAAGPLSNTATVTATGTDPDETNNSATATTIVTAGEQVIYVVTNTDDSGIGSLRQAIGDANAHFGPDTIRFNIPGAGVRTINLASALPQNTEPVTIDGTSQPGFAGTPLIELNGAQAGDGANGLVVNGGNSVIRSLIINRWSGSGIVLQGGDLNVVEGNWLGTGPTGTTALGNGNGILVSSSGNTIGENVISGNTNGVRIALGALGNAVYGNLIGTDVSGTLDVGNTEAGVLILGEANAIGGPNVGARNVISGNDEAGVRLTGGASANTVSGNFIGVDLSGTNPLANGIGVQVGVNVDGTASTNVIGGVVADAGNVIAFNTTIGVLVGQSSSDNAIFGNSIHQNGTLGIDLLGNGVTPNDLGDTDEGANNLTNFPVLNAVAGGVQGTLNSIPDTTFGIEFFGNTACDASGNGEGQIFLGRTAVTTDAAGNATIPLFTATAGQSVTATATDGSNNTSEFSACVLTAEAPEITLTATDADAAELGGNTGTVIVTRTGATTLDRDVAISLDGTAFHQIDYTISSPTLVTSAPGGFTVRIPAGQTTATVTLTPIFSPLVEGSETAVFSAEGSTATVTIADVVPGQRTWISDNSGFWEDPANWSDGIVPIDGDSVVINRPATTVVVTVQSANVSLASLQSTEPLSMLGGSISFSGASALNGGLLMSVGSLGGAGNLTLDSSSFWTGGNMPGPGGLIIAPTGSLSVSSPGAPGVLDRTLTNNGFVAWDQQSLDLTGGAQLINRPGAVFTVLSNLTITNNSGVPTSLTNEGTFNKAGAPGPVTLSNVSFVTSGVVTLRVGDPTDVISANAGGTLGGTLNIGLQPGFTPAPGATFALFAFSSRTGTFTQIFAGPQIFSPTYSPTGLSVTAQDAGTANLGITQTDAPDPVLRGSTLTYTLVATNQGPVAASSVTLIDTLPEDVEFVSAVPSQGTCTGTTIVVCNLGTLAVAAGATVTVRVVPTVSGLLTNTAVITAVEPDTIPANNVATATTAATIPNSTFTVTTTEDSGPGTLRAAMLAANASTGTLDTIVFNIPGAGPHSIALADFLPTITDPLYIDGTSQPGYAGTPVVELDGTGAGAASNGLFVATGGSGSTIRGLAINRFGTGGTPGQAGGAGIVVQGLGGNLIERNFIGTGMDGALAEPNRADAIFIDNSPGNRIGGVSGPSRNLLSGNGRFGLMLNGPGTLGTIVRHNFIGTDVIGTGPVPNGDAGIAIFGAGQTVIGGAEGVQGNTIRFNTGAGIHIASGSENAVLGNNIGVNGSLGINLGGAGITQNDQGDVDTGANALQNFPVLSPSANGVRIQLNSTPNTLFRLELFTNTACDPSGHGEGMTFIAGVPVSTDAGGTFVLETFPAAEGQFLTATATDPDGNTSEFSNCQEVFGDNLPPTANAGPDQIVPVGGLVQLDGTGSSDPEDSPLTYTWILNTRPAGSAATLSATNIASPTFVADLAGTYVAQLLVNDGEINSPSDTITVTTQNGAPIANAGPDQSNIALQATVNLSGAASSDPDGNSITYAWSLILRPAGSAAVLVNPTTATPSFVADVAGRYRAQLVVSDGQLTSLADTVDVTTVNQSPTASAGPDQSLIVGSQVLLNGGGSSDPDNNPLTFAWTFVSRPNGSAATLSNANTSTPSFLADVVGAFVVRLVVNDGIVASAPDDVTVTATPNQIALELLGTSLLGAGRQATLRVTLPAAAPAGGVTATVTSDNPSFVTVGPPNTVIIPAGGTTGDVVLNGVSAGTTLVRANAPGYNEGTRTVTVTQNVLTVPSTLNVPFGSTASFPVSIPAAAPAGGVTVDLVSNAPGSVEVLTPTVTILAGTLSANGAVRGAGIGSATVTASHASFSSASSIVSSTGALNIIETSAALRPAFPGTITIRLESGGNPIAAPAGGLSITLTAANAGCLAPESPVVIPAGLVTATADLNYGGSATLPCTTTLTASASSLTTDVINVTVSPNPGITLFSLPATVGAGLQESGYTARLGEAQHGGVTMRIESSNPGVVRVAPNTTTPGTAFIEVAVLNGQTDVTYVIQGIEGAPLPSAALTATASGFANGTGTVNVVQPAFRLENVPTSTTSLSAEQAFWVRIGIPTAGNANLSLIQNVRTGSAGFTATVTNSNAAVAQLTSVGGPGQSRTVTIPANASVSPTSVATGGVAFDPTGPGTTTVVAAIPGLIATTAATVGVTVSAPGIQLFSLPATVGAGLQETGYTARLGGTQHGGVTMRIESSNPAVVRVAPNATTPGTAFIEVFVPNTQTDVTYAIQGIEGAPVPASATLTATATGFTNATGTANVVQPAFRLENVPTSTTSLSADQAFWVRIGIPTAGNANLSVIQNLRAGGGSLIATVTNSNAAVAQLTTTGGSSQSHMVTIPAISSVSPTSVATGGVAFDPIGGGTTTVTASIPGLIATTAAAVGVTVSAPGLQLFSLPATVGAGLQDTGYTARLGGTQHGGVTMRIESSNPAVVRVAPNATTPGTAFIEVALPNGQTDVTYSIQGVESAPVPASATLTATATGFTNATGTVNVVQPAFRLENVPTSTTSLSADQAFWVRIGIPSAGNTNLSVIQNLRAGGGGLIATVTNSNAAVAQLTTTGGSGQQRTVTIPAISSVSPTSVATGGVAFDPIGGGTTTVTASIPGFIATTAAAGGITVSSPGIQLFSLPATVGAGLQDGGYTVRLGATQHGGVSIRISSSNPSVALISPNNTTPGSAFIDLAVANGQTDATYFIQGVEGTAGTVIISASASGFTDQSGSATIVQPAIRLESLPTSTTSLSTDQPFWVRTGVANASLTNLNVIQNVRPGGGLIATVSNSNGTVARLITSAGPGQTQATVAIPPNSSTSPTSIAAGGVVFDPLAPGTTTVSATVPGYVATAAASVEVTVTSPALSLLTPAATIGAGLQEGAFTARLNAPQHGGVTIRIESAEPNRVRVAPGPNTPGTAFIDLAVANGQTDATYYIQAIEGQSTPAAVTVTATAPGFSSATGSVNVVQAALRIESLATSVSATASTVAFLVRVGTPNASDTNLSATQNVRAGLTLTATVSNSNGSVAQLVTLAGGAQSHTVNIAGVSSASPGTVAAGGIAFDPLQAGTTTVTATIPGFIATLAASVTVDVTGEEPALLAGAMTITQPAMSDGWERSVGGSDQRGSGAVSAASRFRASATSGSRESSDRLAMNLR